MATVAPKPLASESLRCMTSFRHFVHQFWDEIPGTAPLCWNWHLDVICEELQRIAMRVYQGLPNTHDTVINVSPGTSKSSLCSILFQAWVWTFFPKARHLTASHTDTLCLDLANKSRTVIRSDKYRELFPHVRLAPGQNAKGYYQNTHGGDRLTCTVAGKSPMGFHAHYLLCFPGDTLIATNRGQLPIGEVVESRLPVKVLGYDHIANRTVWRDIEEYERSPGRQLVTITFSDGRQLEATSDHPVYAVGRGYVEAATLNPGDEVIYADLQALRKSDPSGEGSLCDLLYERLSAGCDVRSCSPSVFSDQEELRRLWGDYGSEDWQAGNSAVLFSTVSGLYAAGSEESSVEEASADRMSALWGSDADTPTSGGEEPALFPEMRRRYTRKEDGGEGQSELYPRSSQQGVWRSISGQSEEGAASGRLSVLPVRSDRSGNGVSIGRTPHRLEQGQQPEGQSGRFVSKLPYELSGEVSEATPTGTLVVRTVVRSLRIPDAVYNVRIAGTHNYFANGVLVHNCDDPLDPKKAVSEAELRSAQYFFDAVLPSRKVDKAVSTSFLVMQRLHDDDPTGHLLKRSRRPGTTPIRHVCLPAELTADVHPPELAERYRDGLMDPVRLSRAVLQEARANMGEYAYAGQYLQRPVPLTGGLFREVYFVLRAKAAPLESTRVRFWDRASSSGSGCNTAGVLMARAKNGAYYVEHVVAGQWAPDERNDIMLTTAQRDRARYGRHEPRIQIEREGGSSGRDAFLAIARHLDGFPVFEQTVTGDKVTRAEPWSSQCAARNVWIVDDGTWDVAAYINEHCLFPRATLKDRVDASSGAYNHLAKVTANANRPPLRSYRIGARKGEFRVVLCGPHDTPALDLPWLRLCLHDPGSPSPAETAQMPSLLATCELSFADLDVSALQPVWNEPVAGFDKPPAELVMSRDHARRLWAFLSRQQKEGVPVLVIADSNDDRSTSVAMAYCHATGRDPQKVVCRLGEDAWKTPEEPPSRHVYETVKLGQSLVL